MNQGGPLGGAEQRPHIQGSKHARRSFLRAPALFPSCTHKSPLLSHRLNLNKSSPSWPHPPTAASLPRGPEAPTTQAGGEGGLHGCQGRRPRAPSTCTRSTGSCPRTRSHAPQKHVRARRAMCAPAPRQTLNMCMQRPHKTRTPTAPTVPNTCTRSRLQPVCSPSAHRRCTCVWHIIYVPRTNNLCTYTMHTEHAPGTPNSSEHTSIYMCAGGPQSQGAVNLLHLTCV